MRLLRLAEVCRAAGLTVVENAGWQARGVDFPAMPRVLVCHHTATPASAAGDLPTLRLLVAGRSDLPGPLCQVGLSRSGAVHIIAGGKANHAGVGAWQGVTASSGTIGIEAEHPGGAAPWPPAQLDAYDRLCAALLRYLGQSARMLAGHKEWALPAGRKPDPNYSMSAQRIRVERLLGSPTTEDDMTPEQDAMLRRVHFELATHFPSRVAASDYKDTAVGMVLNTDAATYRTEQAARQALAEIAGLRAAVAALAGGDLTAEQVTEAARAGAAAALEARITDAKVTLTAAEGATP